MDYTLKELKDENFHKHFQGVKKAFIVEPYNILLPDHSPTTLDRVKTFEAKEDDVYVVTFVKAGTALIQEIIYLLHNGIDTEAAYKEKRSRTFPYLEGSVWNGPLSTPDAFTLLNSNPSPRLIKTHLHYSLLPPKAIEKNCKMVYVSRNIKDIVVSYFHFAQKLLFMDFNGEVSDFAELFLKDLVPYCPYIDHVRDFWERRNEANILFLTYEDMRKDLFSNIRKTADFFGKSLTDDDVIKIANHCSFENMQRNLQVNTIAVEDTKIEKKGFCYLRKGIVGDWKNHFSTDISEKFEKFLEERVKDSQLRKIIDNSV